MSNTSPTQSKQQGTTEGKGPEKSFLDEEPVGEALDSALLQKLWPFVRPHAALLSLSLLLLPVSVLLVTLRPRIMQYALDEGMLRRDVAVIDKAAALYFAVVVFEYIARFAQVYAMQLAGARAMADLRLHVYRFLQRCSMSFFDSQPVGRLVTRVTNDVDALGELFASGAINAIGDLFSLILIVFMMFSLDWRLSLIAIFCLVPLAIMTSWVRNKAREAFRDIRARVARVNSFLGEQAQANVVTQAYCREESCQRDFDVENKAYREANKRAIFYDAFLDAAVEGVATICAAVILWFIGVRGAKLGLTVVSFGTIVAFLQYLEQFFAPIRDLTSRYTLLQSSMAGAERIFKLLETKGIEDAPETDHPLQVNTSVHEAIAFQDVTHAYNSGHRVLNGVSFRVKKGEHVAIVGATGAGKSTITSLLLRLYPHESGDIRLFGTSSRDLSRDVLRRLFAVVPQDTYLFTGTIASNVAMGDDSPDMQRVEDALRRIGAYEHFANRPDGLLASMSERGGGLSVGERQLIAFARALYRESPILILDEATASVDSDTESKLQHALEAVMQDRTAIVIAHRLSTIRKAHRVIVMHRGEVAEEGTHEELLARDGLYAKLYRLQFSGKEHS